MEGISPPGWSWEVFDHLPAEGHLVQLALHNADRDSSGPKPRKPISPVPASPDHSCDPDTKSWGRNCLLVPAPGPPGSQALLGMGPGPGKGPCESVGVFVACSSYPSRPLSGDVTVTLLGVLTRGREQGSGGDLVLTVPWQRQGSTKLLE